MPNILVILLACAAAAVENDQAYCTLRFRRLCQGKGRHVACQYPAPGPGPGCRNYSQVNFDRELKQFVTNYINRRRQRIAAGHERVRGGARLPRPRIMMFVEWDRELASLAQRLADQCQFAHDDCRATVRYPYAGQTVGEVRLRRRSSGDLNAQRAVRRVLDAWWGERRRAEPRHLVQPFHVSAKGSVWGHFSQLAVWSLRAVGCGAARHGAAHARLLLVCDFSHTNMLGQRTLEPGAPAPCPAHTRRRPHSGFPLLCAALHYQSSDTSDGPLEETEYQYEDEDDFATETTTTNFEAIDARGRRRRPEATTEAFLDDAETRLVTDKAVALTTVADSFYNKLALRLRSSKGYKQKGEEKRVVYTIEKHKEDGHEYSSADSPRVKNRYMKKTEGVDQERKSYTRTQSLEMRTFSNWMTRRSSKQKWTESQEEDQIDQLLHRKHNPEDAARELKLPTTTIPYSSLRTTRQRWNWKRSRDRPRRPGEVALLHVSTADAAIPAQILQDRKPTGALFLMDKDDAVQFFKDTGFHPAWRKNKT